MEYLPHNGNAFDLSVSELLNLMLRVHFEPLQLQRNVCGVFFVCVMCLYAFLCLCPFVHFCAVMKIL